MWDPLILGPGWGHKLPSAYPKPEFWSWNRLHLPSYPETHPIPWPPWSTLSARLIIMFPQGIPRGSPCTWINPWLLCPTQEALLPAPPMHTVSLAPWPLLKDLQASINGAQEAISKRRKWKEPCASICTTGAPAGWESSPLPHPHNSSSLLHHTS